MNELFVGGLTLIGAAAIYILCELLGIVDSRRNRDRIQSALAAVVVGVALISPTAFTAAVDWYAHRKAVELQHQIEKVLTSTTTSAP